MIQEGIRSGPPESRWPGAGGVTIMGRPAAGSVNVHPGETQAHRMGPTETPRVAVVGAGFAGSLTAAHLLRSATKPFDISLIERRPPFGAGVAFKTSLPCHLLNVPVIRMSAIPEEPEHLLRWLAGREAGAGKGFASKAAFLPRHLY